MASIDVARLTHSELSGIAQRYLSETHPTGDLPIPIEEIIDLREKIDIVPIENLSADGHEAFTARDRKTIYVDQGVYRQKNPNRFRYTLAHELAHILIHGNVFDSADYEDVAGFREFLSSISSHQLKQIESQAYTLAGFLLVPANALSIQYAAFDKALKERGMDIDSLTSDSLRHVAKKIGEIFVVSAAVIHRCAVRDRLWEWDDIQDI